METTWIRVAKHMRNRYQRNVYMWVGENNISKWVEDPPREEVLIQAENVVLLLWLEMLL